jgi:probable O-glycosylation ligase (exosortase A-associated)
VRDLLLMAVILGGSLYALRKPWVGAILWTWVSIMNPHEQLAWSAANWPVASIVAICTLLGLLFTRDRQNPFLGAPVWALLGFAIWICVTLPFSIFFDESVPLWQRSMKIFLMLFVTLALLDTRQKLDWFVWAMVVSLGFYGLKGGVFTLATGGNYLVWGPGGFIGGNNELALALVMTIPLMRYLQLQSLRRPIRLGLGAAMLLTAITVLGSYSRGALLAIGSMTLLLWWKSERKVVWGLALLSLAVIMLPFMPDQWWDRMATIRTYEEDASALGRINAWWMAWNLARDRFFGGGFMVWMDSVFRVYAPVADDVHAAHSIYFQVLGEHGFVGLFLFVAILVLTWVAAQGLIRRCAGTSATQWAADLGAMVQVSLLGYAVGGAFLSLAYFDLPYNLMVTVVVAASVVRRKAAAGGGSQSAQVPVPARRESSHTLA